MAESIFVKMTFWENYDPSTRENDIFRKWHYGKMTFQVNEIIGKWHYRKMTSWENDILGK